MQNSSPPFVRRPSLWLAGLLALCLVTGLSAEARPVGGVDARGAIATADLIVAGRVVQVTYPNGLPIAMTDSTSIAMDFTIKPDRVLMGDPSAASQNIEIHVETYRGVGDHQYGLFFLKRRPEGDYTVVNPDHTCLVALPGPPVPDTPSTDINTAVARELIAVLATPRKILTDSEQGMQYGPSIDPAAEADAIYEEATQALVGLPAGAVIEPLRKATSSSELLNRLWASSVLFDFGDMSILAQTAPTLMAPPPYAFRAASRAGFALSQIKSADAVPILVPLLESTSKSTRYGAASALRQIGTPAVIVPLGKLTQSEEDPQVLTQTILGLCEATHTKSAVCSYDTQLTRQAENLEASRQWAKTFVANGSP